MFKCIGIRALTRGTRPQACPNTTDETPNPAHPTWPYLCSECANEPPRSARRPQYRYEGEDVDKPNQLEDVDYDGADVLDRVPLEDLEAVLDIF